MKATFHHWMLFAAVTSAAVVSSAQAGTLYSDAVVTTLAGETPLHNKAVGAEDLSNATSGLNVALSNPSSWADGLMEKNLAETSRLLAPEAPLAIAMPSAQPILSDALLNDVKHIHTKGANLDLNAVEAITNALLSDSDELSQIIKNRSPESTRAARHRDLEQIRSLIATMGNGIIVDQCDNVSSLASEGETSAQIDNGTEWSAEDPTAEYLDFSYRAYDFKQFVDSNSKTVAVKVDINRMVDSTTPVDIELDNVIDGLFDQEANQTTGSLAASLDGPVGSLDNFAATPEPSSMLMMGLGLFFFSMNTRRQRRRRRLA